MFGICGPSRLFLRWLVALLMLAVLAAPRLAQARDKLVRVRVEGVINPIKARLVERAVKRAQAEDAELLLVSIDTPGGLVSSMQEIVSQLNNARLPVVTHVGPSSAQASSAGAFILLSGDLSAMAPGTRIGAAHPVGDGGKELEGPINDKLTNSLTSMIRSLAERRGRPVEAAEAMVEKSKSYTAEQAHAEHLVELLATDEPALLRALDGKQVHGRTLHTQRLTSISVELSGFDRLVDTLADPTLTSLLLSLGTLALVYELASPGIGAGGVIGAVLLLLALLGSSVLSIELSAVALLLVGVVALALEFKLPTHGVLGGAGVLSVVFGALLLVDSADYFGGSMAVNPLILVPVVAAMAVGLLLLGRAARRAMSAPPLTGLEALLDRLGTAKSSFGSQAAERTGTVHVDGARWAAETDEPQITSGERVRVVAVATQPTRLFVRRESRES